MASDQFCLFQLICLCQDERTDYARRLHDWRFFGPGGSIQKEEDPVTARKTGSSVWSVELYFGIDFCFWLLYKNFIQKLTL